MAQRETLRRALALPMIAVLAGCGVAGSSPDPDLNAIVTSDVLSAPAPSPSSLSKATASGAPANPELALKTGEATAALITMSGPANADGTLGSGCSTEDFQTVPDGTWFVFVMDYRPARMTFDIACAFGSESEQWQLHVKEVGEDAAREGERYVVSNDVTVARDMPIAVGTNAYLEAHDWEPVTTRQARDDFAQQAPGSGLWVVVEDGKVCKIVEPESHTDLGSGI